MADKPVQEMTAQELVDEMQRLSAITPMTAAEQLALTSGTMESANLAVFSTVMELGNEVRSLYRAILKMSSPSDEKKIDSDPNLADIDVDAARRQFAESLQRASLMQAVEYMRSRGKKLTVIGGE